MTTLDEGLDAAIALESFMAEAAEGAYSEKVPTRAEMTAALLQAIDNTDIDYLLGLQDVMKSHIDKVTANAIDLDNLGELSPKKAEELMEELVDQKQIEALLNLRYSMIRAAVFAHINADNVAKKKAHPDKAPGEIPVPKLGKRFTREGGKMKGDFDREQLAETLTKAQYDRIFKVTQVPARVIAAHTVVERDDDALRALIAEDPTVMEKLRAAVVPVGFTTSTFHHRKLTIKKD